MLFAMCFDTSMLVGLLFLLLLASAVFCGLLVLAVVGVTKLIEARRTWPGVIPVSPENIPLSPENIP